LFAQVDILNLTAVQLSSQFTFMYQAWARTARITLCNSDELNQLEALFDGLLKGDNALLALKTSFYNDRFGYVQIPYSNGAGFGFGVLINVCFFGVFVFVVMFFLAGAV
jgi:hypothetical protein